MILLFQRLLSFVNGRREEWLLLVRFCLGIIFIQSGWGKLVHINETIDFFTQLGIPFPAFNAVFASLTEFVGGLLIVVGFASRFMSLALIGVMVVAILTAQLQELHTMVDLFGLQEMDYILLFGVIVVLGAGKWSLDGLIKRFWL